MKKFGAIILILAVCTVFLAGCNNIASPSTVWWNHEVFTYAVTNESNADLGELIMTVERLDKADISLGSYSASNFTGSKVTYQLTVNEVEATVESAAITSKIEAETYFSTKLLPVMSYKKTQIYDKEKGVMNVDTQYSKYDGETYKYVFNEESKELSIKKKTLIDNEALLMLLRAYDISNSSFSLKFEVPSPKQDLTQPMIAETLSTSQSKEVLLLNSSVDVLSVAISLDSKLSGTIVAYYAKNAIAVSKDEESLDVDKALVEFIEDEIIYRLTKIEVL